MQKINFGSLSRFLIVMRHRQSFALAALALSVVLLTCVVPRVMACFTPAAAATPVIAAAPGTFRPTDGQWAGFNIVPVQLLTFRSEEDTDGKIANNDDTTTPAFSPYSGRVTRIFAKAGDTVTKGDPLLVVEASEFVQGQNDLVAATAAATTARAQFKLAETAEQRQKALFEAKGGALKDWQQSQVDLANAQGALRTADVALSAARNRLRILGKSDREITALENGADGRRMGLEAVVPSPITGTVIQRQVGVGQYINAGSGGNPIFSIGDLSTVWLVANVREAEAANVKIGQSVEVRVLAYPRRVFRAKLTFVAPAIDPTIRRLPVRAEVENIDGALKPEMFARFRILTGNEDSALAVPETAVIRQDDIAQVWVANPAEKTVALRQIHTGPASEGMVAVRDGLMPGESVVTSGALFIDHAATNE